GMVDCAGKGAGEGRVVNVGEVEGMVVGGGACEIKVKGACGIDKAGRFKEAGVVEVEDTFMSEVEIKGAGEVKSEDEVGGVGTVESTGDGEVEVTDAGAGAVEVAGAGNAVGKVAGAGQVVSEI